MADQDDKKTPGESNEDFSQAEAVAGATESVEGSLPVVTDPDQEKIARRKARSIVGAMERFFKFFHKDLNYDEAVFRKGEECLAPAIEKHQLSDSLPFKYSEEVSAVGFVGGLAWDSFSALGAMLEADAQKKAQAEKKQKQAPVKTTTGDQGEEVPETKSKFEEMQ